ncbi:MAG: pyridoxal phosphate-dependent aminotransferase [Deltaproteobacteria bacterium]|nr:pyridoxal phosphate-dependent aminotransferase [Deltaproteobacteria bacterium]
MPVSRKIQSDMRNASEIRRLFEEGIRLKEIHGPGNVADLSLGNPIVEPPSEFASTVCDLVRQRAGMHRYMPNLGFPWVRAAVADALTAQGYFDALGPQHVMMCAGAAAGMNVVLKTILNPGEKVVVVAPYFVEYRAYVENHGGELTVVQPAEDFSLDVGKIGAAITRRTRAVIINSPNNPTGVVYSRENLAELAEMLYQKRRFTQQAIYVVSDEPYREIIYDGETFSSIASLYTESFMVYSFSKSLGIPGERIGYVAVNPAMEDCRAIMDGMAICNRILGFVNAPALMQRAVAELAVRVDVDGYRLKRDMIKRTLQDNGYEFARPQGTFYIFARCPDEERAFIDRAREMLLLVVPGSAFGYRGWFRIAYCVDEHTVELACQKLSDLAETCRS